ncbi:MAG: 50S ribosomal protein L21 [Bacteroidetes bacterium]|nr:50S ribosomal protein L21 [Bacteroidota bacterium]
MFAIVTIAGQQFKVTKNQTLYVHHLSNEEGANLEFSDVLLINNEGSVRIGTPNVSGAKVTATIVESLVKGDKVIVFKKKRRKGYRLMKGHRQQFSKIKINEIVA